MSKIEKLSNNELKTRYRSYRRKKMEAQEKGRWKVPADYNEVLFEMVKRGLL